MSYEITSQTQTSSSIFAGTTDLVKNDITVESGQGELIEGQWLGMITASGKYAVYDDAATDGTEVRAGILVEDIDATSADVNTTMWVHGEFNGSKLTPATDAGTYSSIFVK